MQKHRCCTTSLSNSKSCLEPRMHLPVCYRTLGVSKSSAQSIVHRYKCNDCQQEACYQFYYEVNVNEQSFVHICEPTQQESPLRGFEGFTFASRGCTLPSSALNTRSCAWLFPIPPLNYSYPAGFNPPLLELHARLISAPPLAPRAHCREPHAPAQQKPISASDRVKL